MNENKKPCPKGAYNCEFVSASRSKRVRAAKHMVLNIRLRPTDCGIPPAEVCEYFAELPLFFRNGEEYAFYDRDKGVSVTRKCTSEDTAAAWEYARKCFPEWAKYLDNLPDSASFAEAVAWFDEPPAGIIVRAGIKDVRTYTGGDGMEYQSWDASIYEFGSSAAVIGDANALNDEFGKMFAASKARMGARKPAAKPSAAVARPSPKPSPKPSPSPAPAAEPKTTGDDAWNTYENGDWGMTYGLDGYIYWGIVEKIVGKPRADYEKFTGFDWEKCVKEFGGVHHDL